MASDALHERHKDLSDDVLDAHRAYQSLMEELEAVDWYSQRAQATSDDNLRDILNHNKKEEMEHACMTLEWIRRNQEGWHKTMKKYLFKEKKITKIEKRNTKKENHNQNLKIGKIKIRKNKDGHIKTELSAHNR